MAGLKPVPARIEGILARAADVAVVFRRGPGDRTQCLRWDLARDEVTPGQWIRGRIAVRRCDLSSDGELLVGAYANYSAAHIGSIRARGATAYEDWSAVSRVPYFTALSVWENGGGYGGGGVWSERRRLGLNRPGGRTIHGKRGTIEIAPLAPIQTDAEAIFAPRLRLAGWEEVQRLELREPPVEAPHDSRHLVEREGIWIKSFAGGELRRRIRDEREIWELRDADDTVRREFRTTSRGAPLLDVDHGGRVIFGEAGRLWTWRGFPLGEPTMIADLNANAFEAVAPPAWVREWPA